MDPHHVAPLGGPRGGAHRRHVRLRRELHQRAPRAGGLQQARALAHLHEGLPLPLRRQLARHQRRRHHVPLRTGVAARPAQRPGAEVLPLQVDHRPARLQAARRQRQLHPRQDLELVHHAHVPVVEARARAQAHFHLDQPGRPGGRGDALHLLRAHRQALHDLQPEAARHLALHQPAAAHHHRRAARHRARLGVHRLHLHGGGVFVRCRSELVIAGVRPKGDRNVPRSVVGRDDSDHVLPHGPRVDVVDRSDLDCDLWGQFR